MNAKDYEALARENEAFYKLPARQILKGVIPGTKVWRNRRATKRRMRAARMIHTKRNTYQVFGRFEDR